jgi:hypothetical protein
VPLWETPFWIGDREFTADDLCLIETIVREFKNLSRTELAATVCENLPWKAPNGRVKVNGCLLLLERMEKEGLIVLPPRRANVVGSICNLESPPLPATEIRSSLSRLRPITVEPVPYEENRVWNATVATYHPLGFQRPFGAHQRYWIYSRADGENRILGALLFAAPAKALADRDRWIGWSAAERRRYLYRIVGNSRFLILPGVEVPHLASHVLKLALRRLRGDWSQRYGYAPSLVETFVTPPYKGTCYRAANWLYIGESGRTRYSKKNRPNGPVRMIFVCPLVRNWREELCAPTPVPNEEGDWGA